MRIVFMGTPDFAVCSLQTILKTDHEVVGVITAPDKPAGRGHQLQQSPVKVFAQRQQLRILQPTRLQSPEFLEELKALRADLQVVVAFRMLPEVVWNMPPKGTINLHASLLPQYRGAAPINRAIMNGERESGVTTFFIQQQIDTGNVLLQKKVSVGENETAGELHDKLMVTGAALLADTVEAIATGNIRPVAQKEMTGGPLKEAPKIFRNDCRIHWDQPADHVFNHIRGLIPYPGSWCKLKDETDTTFVVKIHDARRSDYTTLAPAGTLRMENQKMYVACAPGWVELTSIQMPGKKRMLIHNFLNGSRINANWHFY